MFCLALLVSGAPFAQSPPTAQQEFQAGRRAYEAQDYAGALRAFEAAVAAGMTGPAVHFNIGVAAFRVDEYERARRAFTAVARTPAMAALAHYNLGLVEQRRGREALARRWFERARDEAADDRLRALAVAKVAELPEPPPRSWLGFASVGMGYDDNVTLVAANDVLDISEEADPFAEITAALTGPLDRDWGFDAGVIATKYADLDEFDQLVAHGAARYGIERGAWLHTASLEAAHTQLGGDGFENRIALGLQTTTGWRDWRVRLRYRYSDLDGLDGYGGLDGARHDVQARLRRRAGAWDYGFEYGFEVSDYRDDALSVHRHKLAFACERELPRGWRAGLDSAVRFSNYELDSHGSEERIEVGLFAKKRLSHTWHLAARYDYANNSAPQSEFDYRSNRVWVGAEATL